MSFKNMLTDVTPLRTSFMFHFFLSLPGNKVPSFTNHHPGERSKSREKGKLAPDELGGLRALANPTPYAQQLSPFSLGQGSWARLEKEA